MIVGGFFNASLSLAHTHTHTLSLSLSLPLSHSFSLFTVEQSLTFTKKLLAIAGKLLRRVVRKHLISLFKC